MHVFEMVVLIVLIGAIASTVSKFMERKSAQSDMLDAMSMGESETSARLAHLEERVAVLEKIVTDKNYDLKREFDQL